MGDTMVYGTLFRKLLSKKEKKPILRICMNYCAAYFLYLKPILTTLNKRLKCLSFVSAVLPVWI